MKNFVRKYKKILLDANSFLLAKNFIFRIIFHLKNLTNIQSEYQDIFSFIYHYI